MISEIDHCQIAVSLTGWETKTTRSRFRSWLAEVCNPDSDCYPTKGEPYVVVSRDISPIPSGDALMRERLYLYILRKNILTKQDNLNQIRSNFRNLAGYNR